MRLPRSSPNLILLLLVSLVLAPFGVVHAHHDAGETSLHGGHRHDFPPAGELRGDTEEIVLLAIASAGSIPIKTSFIDWHRSAHVVADDCSARTQTAIPSRPPPAATARSNPVLSRPRPRGPPAPDVTT